MAVWRSVERSPYITYATLIFYLLDLGTPQASAPNCDSWAICSCKKLSVCGVIIKNSIQPISIWQKSSLIALILVFLFLHSYYNQNHYSSLSVGYGLKIGNARQLKSDSFVSNKYQVVKRFKLVYSFIANSSEYPLTFNTLNMQIIL